MAADLRVRHQKPMQLEMQPDRKLMKTIAASDDLYEVDRRLIQRHPISSDNKQETRLSGRVVDKVFHGE